MIPHHCTCGCAGCLRARAVAWVVEIEGRDVAAALAEARPEHWSGSLREERERAERAREETGR